MKSEAGTPDPGAEGHGRVVAETQTPQGGSEDGGCEEDHRGDDQMRESWMTRRRG